MKHNKLLKVFCAGMTSALMLTSLTACSDKKEETTTKETTAEQTTSAEETKDETTTEGETTAESETSAEGETTTEATTEETKETTAAASAFTLPETFSFEGKFDVKVVGYEYWDTGDKYDYDLVNVYYDFTCKNDDVKKIAQVYWKAEQNGEELKKDPNSNSTFKDMDHNDDMWLFFQNGVTYRSVVQFACEKGGKDLITVSLGDSKENMQSFDIDPAWEMPDIRHEDFELAKIDKPALGPGNLTEGTKADGKFDIKINGVTGIFTGTDLDRDSKIVEHKVVGVSFTVTNHTGKEDSPFMIAMNYCYVFQDGVTLMHTGSPKGSEDEGKTQKDLPLYQKIADGETATYTVYFKLRSDSPIEVLFKEAFKLDFFADMVYDVKEQ